MDKKDRFALKTFSIAYELPFFDLNDQQKLTELGQSLANVKRTLVETLSISIDYFQYGNGPLSTDELPQPKIIEENNILFLFTLVIRVDKNFMTEDEFKETWNTITNEVEASMTGFMEANKLMYRIIREL